MALAYDTATVGKSASTTSLSFSHTCSSSADRVLYVATNNRDAGAGDVTGVTYNGVAMTQLSTTLDGAPGNSKFRVWKLVNPATGANNVVVTISGARPIIAVAISFTGADQTDPDGALTEVETTLDTAITGNVASVDAGNLTVSFVFAEDTTQPAAPEFTPTGTATHTERVDDAQGNQYIAVGTQDATGTVTASWTYDSAGNADGGYALVAFEVIASAGAAAATTGLLINGGLINNGLISGHSLISV